MGLFDEDDVELSEDEKELIGKDKEIDDLGAEVERLEEFDDFHSDEEKELIDSMKEKI